MPAPIAKGIIITVSVLVAAGIAVYESPEIRRWLDKSRRRIAVALYSLGDDIHPRDIVDDDISLTEDTSEDAQARRQRAREEILQKAALLKSRRKTSSSSSTSNDASAPVSFDALVDQDGRLRRSENTNNGSTGGVKGSDNNGLGASTAIDLEASLASGSSKLMPRNIANNDDNTSNRSKEAFSLSNSQHQHRPALTESRLQAQREMLEAMDHDRLRLDLPPFASEEASSHHPSESLVDLTPTSEFPGTDGGILEVPHDSLASSTQQQQQPQRDSAASEYFSVASSNLQPRSDAGSEPEYYYAHPSNPTVEAGGASSSSNPFGDNRQVTAAEPALSSTGSSVHPGSLSHVNDVVEVADALSDDGTLSDWGRPGSSAGIATPASWSEVGSVVSSDDGHHA